MNREHVMRFLMALTCERTVSRENPRAPDHEAIVGEILQRFFDVFPREPETASIYARVSRPPDPRRLKAFEAWLNAQHQRTADSTYEWAAHHLGRAQEPLMHTAPQSEPSFRRPSAAEAMACVKVLEGMERGDRADAGRMLLARTMPDLIEAWADEVWAQTEDRTCPDCGVGYVLELDAARHLVSCAGHPAMVRHAAAVESARLTGAQPPFPPQIALPMERRWPYGQRYEAQGALAFVLHPATNRKPRDVEEPHRLLGRVATEWAHFVDRATDSCPWCGEVRPLPEFHGHLRRCEEHPAAKAARALLSSARIPVALDALVFEWMRARQGLMLLVRACDVFDKDMGWTGTAGYSDQYSERPWHAAIGRAASLLRLPTTRAEPPRSGTSTVRAVVARFLAEPTGTHGEAEALRTAAAELDGWAEDPGYATRCPACDWLDVPRSELARHLEQCLLHPAVREGRAAAAIEQLRTGVAALPTPLDAYPLPDHRDRFRERSREQRRKAVQALIQYDARELADRQPEELQRLVDDWEELHAVVTTTRCPWCHDALPTAEHLLRCPAHPAGGAAAEPSGPLEELAVRLRREADVCTLALARLYRACGVFWSGMRDGEDGKSISSPEIEAPWNAARADAATVLAAIPERP